MPSDAASPDEGSLRYPGWRVVLLCFLMAVLCWGLGFYGHGFYIAELRHLHGWPTGLISTASTAYYLVSAVLIVFISDTIRRFGVRTCVLAGAIAFASSAAALPFITAPWQLFAAYLVMAIGWSNMSVGAITNILGLWFDQKRGLAISLALNGASLSGVIVVPFLVLLTGYAGFTTAMLASAAGVIFVFVPLALVLLGAGEPKPGRAASRSSAPTRVAAASPGAPPHLTRRSALRTLSFWSVSAPFALAIFSQAGFLVHQLPFLESVIGRYQAGIAVAVTTAMAIVGRLALGAAAGRIDQRIASTLSLASQAAALAIMTQSSDRNVLLAACALYGFSVGNVITFPALIIQSEFAPAAFGMIVGLSMGLGQFTYAFGPGVIGLVRDATGGYTTSLWVCIVLNLVAAAAVGRRPARTSQAPGTASRS
jgi:MFS family permease